MGLEEGTEAAVRLSHDDIGRAVEDTRALGVSLSVSGHTTGFRICAPVVRRHGGLSSSSPVISLSVQLPGQDALSEVRRGSPRAPLGTWPLSEAAAPCFHPCLESALQTLA